MAWLAPILSGLFKVDERFVMHRFYSTRLAMAVGLLAIVIWFNYEIIVNQTLRWDLAIIVGIIALTKVGAMIFYRITG